MKKTFAIAAVLLTLGSGAAFAGDGDVYVPQLQGAAAGRIVQPAQQAAPAHRLFATQGHAETWLYPSFGYAGLGGGQN
ncbi:MAG: hypothetical protein BGO51_10910 [Rhodospirillales bacterium 69-11]|nr:hypothetical protein [Rhodospirillales bacterium]MBN8928197.1 hypothetical protein [Rhodospirillales bacterium]OJW29549.1 MAG: hypothetical protein BGO51_10910 [Rhodospirillales bacterium 69-11]